MISRRALLKRFSSIPLVGGIFGTTLPLHAVLAAPEATAKRDLIKELGLRTFINAAGNYTTMTASLMPKEVMETINASAKEYVMLRSEERRVGKECSCQWTYLNETR